MASVALENIRKSFGAVEVIRDVSLTIDEGEFVVLVGPSGCGKSTLMRCIAGLETVSSGRVLLDDVDMTNSEPVARGVAMVFQSYALYPHMTVSENLGFGLKIAKQKKAEIKKRVLEVAKFLKLDELLDRKPKALSGGQRQRVAIGRALVREPKIFLFDEPLSNLDASLRAEMRVELAKLHNNLGNTMIYVTHDQIEAMTLADKMVILKDGAIEQVGAPLELFNNPVNKFVAGFLGQPPMNFIKVKSAKTEGDALKAELPDGKIVSVNCAPDNQRDLSDMELGVRPENIALTTSEDGIRFKISVVEQLGDETILYGHISDGQPMTIQLAGQSRYKSNQEIRVELSTAAPVIFDKNGKNISVKSV